MQGKRTGVQSPRLPPTVAAIADRRKIYLPLELESDFWALLRKTRPGMVDVPGRTG